MKEAPSRCNKDFPLSIFIKAGLHEEAIRSGLSWEPMEPISEMSSAIGTYCFPPLKVNLVCFIVCNIFEVFWTTLTQTYDWYWFVLLFLLLDALWLLKETSSVKVGNFI